MDRKVRWELRHDTLGPRIWAKLPEQDRLLRQMRRSITQRTTDYFEGKGSLAGETELLSWRDWESRLQLEEKEQKFIKLSWEDVHKKRKEKEDRMFDLAVQAKREKKLRKEAETAKHKAELNAERAQYRIRGAIIFFIFAFLLLIIAQYKLHKSSKNLLELKEKEKFADELIVEANELILQLKYDEALMKLKIGPSLLKEYPPLGQIYMELVFFLGETRQVRKAEKLYKTTSRLFGRENLSDDIFFPSETEPYLSTLHDFLMELDKNHFQEVYKKYYPDMIFVRGGDFEMGCDESLNISCIADTKPLHKVSLDSFYVAKTETTIWQYYLYCLSNGKSMLSGVNQPELLLGHNPVADVNWYDALDYANWVSTRQGLDRIYNIEKGDTDTLSNNDELEDNIRIIYNHDGNGYRLPTEAEWEYAADGGINDSQNVFSGSNAIWKVGWYKGNAAHVKPVATITENSLGLFDMSGNVWEWCWDWYKEDYYIESGGSSNPTGPTAGKLRVVRGGSYYVDPSYSYIFFRNRISPLQRYPDLGFRLVRTAN